MEKCFQNKSIHLRHPHITQRNDEILRLFNKFTFVLIKMK